MALGLGHSNFGFVSDFELRISYFSTSVHVRIRPEVLEHFLALAVVVHEVEALAVVLAFGLELGLAEERGVGVPVAIAAGLAEFLERVGTGVAEALEMADRLGIDGSKLDEVIEGGPLDAPIADAKLHKMERGDFAVEFPMRWALKDVDLALAAAGDGAAPPLLAALSRQWHAAVDAGLGKEDVSAARAALGGHPKAASR